MQFKYGDCISVSQKEYNRLRKQGLKPLLVEGWVEVNNPELLPNIEFLKLYMPNEYKAVMIDKNFDDYTRVLQHTWIILDNNYIDKTKSQFDLYGGIINYFEKWRYYLI